MSKTNVFARRLGADVQALAYSMNLATTREVAMVLPLPVAHGRGEDAVAFVDLSAHPRMFSDFHELFEPVTRAKGGFSLARSRLVVHEVGAFIASYVPARADFARLDPRFRLPDALFDAVPHYADYGFAVFQLAPGKVTVHPMGLTFPTRDARLFFPTVHVHDGRFHPRARFDHALYYQAPRPTGDDESLLKPARSYGGLVAEDLPLARRRLRGTLTNADTWIA